MAESTADRIRSALAEAPARRYPAVLEDAQEVLE